jgi:hypothetical protein
MSEEIKACEDCRVPLIFTFSFVGKEWWCANCGRVETYFNGQPYIKKTKKVESMLNKMKKENSNYLRAEGILNGGAYATEYKGKKVEIKDLPESFIRKLKKDLKLWKPNKYVRR